MSIDPRHEAAALMRQRAEAATPGPWRFTDSEAVYNVSDGGMVVVGVEGDPIANVCDEWYEPDPGEPAPINDAEHIASWPPGVAVAAAELLHNSIGMQEQDVVAVERALLKFARAYLGESS